MAISSLPKQRSSKGENIQAALPQNLRGRESPPRIVVILAKDEVRPIKIIEAIKAKWFEGKETRRIDLSQSLDISSLKGELQTLSLFSSERLFIYANFEELSTSKQGDFITAIAGQADGISTVIPLSSFPKSHPLRKICKEDSEIIELQDLEGSDLQGWVTAELKLHELTEIESGVQDYLLRIANYSPDTVATLIYHLSIYCQDNKVTKSDLKALFSEPDIEDEFEILSLINDNNPSKIEIFIEKLLRDGKSPFAILGLLARVFTNYHTILSGLARGDAPQQIQIAMKMPPWLFSKTVPNAKRYSLKQLDKHIREILRADLRLKGRSLGHESTLAILCHYLKPQPNRG